MINDYSFVRDPNGRFYAGMTLKEAQMDGTDKSFWRRDFHNLDKNSDGVLSVKEIMDERKRSSKINKWCVGGFSIWGLLDVLANRGSKGWLIADLIIDGFIIASSLLSAHKIDKGTELIENELRKRSQVQNLSVNT